MSDLNTSDPKVTHSTVTLAQPQVHASHPFKHKTNHSKLRDYIRARLNVGMKARDARIDRLVRIDKNVSGWLRLDEADRKRAQQKDEDGTPLAVKMNLPLSFIHLDDMMTYFAETFAPSRGMFYHSGDPEEVDEARQIIVKMNNDAIYAGFYRQTLRGIYSCLKYNEGGFEVTWSTDRGPKLGVDQNDNKTVETELKWAGNRMEALDMYNTMWDPGVTLTDLHKDGEFAAKARLRSHYWLQSRAAQGVFFNCEAALSSPEAASRCKYYRSPPAETEMDQDSGRGSGTNWVDILSEGNGYRELGGYELVTVYIRLNPMEFGLLQGTKENRESRNRYEIWRFTLLNDEWLIEAQWMNNVHGHIPYYGGVLNDDLMGATQKSTAEILQPLQDFASFLMNLHVEASRSSLWGVTFYDPSVIDMSKIPKGEVVARVPIESRGYGKDIRNAIYEQSSTLETKQTLSDLTGVMDMINQFFPTQSLPSQIASIDRAVTSQVAAVQHGANRRQQKAARLLDDSTFSKIRYAMYYNIIQYAQEEEKILDYYSGKEVDFDIASMRNTNLPYIIGQGLKAIDRQAAAQQLNNLIFAMIQAPQAAQGVDLLGLIDYWSSMMDIDIDMKQFRLEAPADGTGVTTQQQEQQGVQPATSAEAITGGAIYGD